MQPAWIQALGKMIYGIYVLTTFHKEEINGMIASWVSQISYDPPLIMVAIHPNRYTHHLIEQSGCIALHLLAKGHRGFLTRFKSSDPKNKFSAIQWVKGKTGCPILKDCAAYLECEVKTTYRPGNHTLFFARVVEAQVLSEESLFSTMDYDGIYLGKF